MNWKRIKKEWLWIGDHRLDLSSASLTYYTLLAIVPTLAIAFGIAQKLGIERYLSIEVVALLHDHPQIADKILEFTHATLAYVSVDLLTSTAALFLFWSAGTLLYTIESVMNGIWGVEKARPLWRLLLVYLAVILLTPLFLALSSSITLLIGSLAGWLHQAWGLQLDSIGYRLALAAVSLAASWAFCTLVLMLMPNRRVPLAAALPAGMAAGSAFQLLQWFYFYIQHLLTSYSIIYGSFAAFPLFLIWLQTSWRIILIGALLAVRLTRRG